jgi:hypothetical protein
MRETVLEYQAITPVAPPIEILCGIHYTEGERVATSGSLRDLPRGYFGTTGWWPGTDTKFWYCVSGYEENPLSFSQTVFTYKVSPHRPTASDSYVDIEMSQLEVAALTGDEYSFVTTQKAMDWGRRSPEDFVQAIRLALTAGAHRAARDLSMSGAARYPDHEELRKYARVLAPPQVRRSDIPPNPTMKANCDWLMRHGDSYRGQWVALCNGKLVGSGDSLKALTDQLGNTKGLLLTKVY